MTSPFLITHLVRGQPAFDIAEQMTCSICQGASCDECDDGYWWIIPTSGHRAYPYWHKPLFDHYVSLLPDGNLAWTEGREATVDGFIDDPLPDWPDHYAINNRALRSAPSSSLADRLGLNLQQSSAPIRRRV